MTDAELEKLATLISMKLQDPLFMTNPQFKERAGISDWDWQNKIKDHPLFKKARSSDGRKVNVKNGLYAVNKILMGA